MNVSSPTRSERFLQALCAYERFLVVTHDNPDPDAVASGWAVAFLIHQRLGKEARLVGGGDVIRAENRHMIKLLEPPLELVRSVECPPNTGVILVDCMPGAQNHLFSGNGVPPVAVIDHHSSRRSRRPLAFQDIRPRAAASASITASYLREQKLEPGPKLATAMVFAIRTETSGSETYYSRLDRSVVPWLTARADPSWLAEIENAPLTPAYFSDLVLALQGTFLYDDSAFCVLPRAHGAEIVGEVADLLIRCQSIRRVLCGAVVGGDLVLSVRTERDGADAAELVRATLKGLGHGGGHRHRAGGKIPGLPAPKVPEDLEADLRTRWLAACGVDRQRGTRLIAKREIVNNL